LVFSAAFDPIFAERRMLALGLTLVLFGAGAAEAVPGPRLSKGDELHYVGEIVESSETVDNPFRKTHSLEIRLFILEADETAAIGALLTVVGRDFDPALSRANIARKGMARTPGTASAKLEFVRIDSRGRAEFLDLPNAGLPLRFGQARRRAEGAFAPEALPASELGFLIPTPAGGAVLGKPWQIVTGAATSEWRAEARGTWNGRRCWEVTGRRSSVDYDRPEVAPRGWNCVSTLMASPADGFATSVQRETVRRFGKEQIGKITAKYELQPTNRYVGTRYLETRREIETAYAMTAEFEASLDSAKPHEHAARAARLQRYLEDHPGTDGFAVAFHALKRRAEAMASGSVPFVTVPAGKGSSASAEPLPIGSPAPDFIAADVDLPGNRFRLHAAKGKPVVLVFFKPQSPTSRDALTVAEALSKRYRDVAAVVPLAIAGKPEAASAQRSELKYGVPVFDGSEVRKPYRISTFPQFLLVDGDGRLSWVFDAGVGPEVGHLVKEALDKLLPGAETK
jgi:hypothetical protein